MQIPFFSQLEQGQRFLIVGAGGGFDFIQGLPLYLYITQTLKKSAVFGNYSFSALEQSQSPEVCENTYQVSRTSAPLEYFPERLLAQWFWETYQIDIPVYAFNYGMGVIPLTQAYNYLIKKYDIDTILLIDGGTDSIIFGDEKSLGTIVEDACSMVAAVKANARYKYIAAVGFGIDHFHGINHYNFLENVATLIKNEGYLGAFSLTKEMDEGSRYLQLTEYLNQHNNQASIVNNSIASAMVGDFGDVHRTTRTGANELFINPLMPLYWTFNLESVVDQMAFAKSLEECYTISEIVSKIRIHQIYQKDRHRHSQPLPL